MTEPTEVEHSGLLADPAQTTELEKLRTQVALLGRHLQSSADKDKRIIAWRVEAEQAHQNWEAARAANMTALETIAELRAERDERQTRIDKALEWWRQERDADHCWPLSFEDSAKVNSLRYRLYAALTGHPLAEQPLPGEALRNAEERDDAAGDLP